MPTKIRSVLLAVLSICVVGIAATWERDTDSNLPPKEIVPALRVDGPKYWKGNLHTHSLWSDGNDFPEMIADWYKRHDYDFLALTDHNVLSVGERWIDSARHKVAMDKYLGRFGKTWIETRKMGAQEQVRLKPLSEFRSVLEEPGKFLLVQGEEITHRFARYPVHLNAINLREVIQPIDGDDVAETISVNRRAVADQRKRVKQDMIAFLNHPNFGWGIRAEDMIRAAELRYFEVFNGHPSVGNYGDKTHPSCEQMWDIVLALRLGKLRLPVLYGLATDDAHRYHQWGVGKVNPGRGWIMVKAPYLTAEAMVRAMEKGDFYCSSGVTLNEIRQDDKQLALSIRGEKGMTYRTQFIATMKDASLDSKPRLDDKGKPLNVTRVYSDDVGKVVSEVNGLAPTYRFTGKELYVRAKVISSKPHPNPYKKGDVEVAWTQPVVPSSK